MSILYDEGQEAIATEARRVLEARFEKDRLLALLEKQGAYDEGFWATCKEQGWTGVTLPEAYGGLELGLVEMGLIAEACGRCTAGAPFLSTSFAAADGLQLFGTDALKDTWLPALASGEAIGCIGFAEAGATVPATPSLRFDGNSLKGMKPAVPAGGHADLALVLADKDGTPALAAVALKDNGVEADILETFDNSRCAADLTFDGARADVLLTGEVALDAVRTILARLAVVTAHEQVGGAGALLEAARDYALERKAFGQVIGAFQSVKHRIAEIYANIELARANAVHAASLGGKDGFLTAAAAARLTAIDAYDIAARDATQVHGGIGVTWEAGLHLHQRRTRTLAIEGGPSTYWEDLLVDQLVAEDAA